MTAPSAAAGLRAELTLRRPEAGRVGAERVALLRAIRDTGAISEAAKQVGLSYKGAWDAVQVLNNLFERPLVAPSAGGRDGGASVVTPAGEAVLAAYSAVEVELAELVGRLEARLAGGHGAAIRPLLWGFPMKTSARNTLRGTVSAIVPGAVNSEVRLDLGGAAEIVAIITRESVDDLGLQPGAEAFALIKSSFVILARGDERLRTSARNQLRGTVSRREDGAVNSEVTLELEGGKLLTSTLTLESAEVLDLRPGAPVLALVKASHVILAVD